MENTLGPGDGGRCNRHYPLKALGNCFEEEDDAEGSGRVIGGLARLVQDHPIGGFQRRGVVAERQQGPVEFKDAWEIDEVDFLLP